MVDLSDADGGIKDAPSIRGIQHEAPDPTVNLEQTQRAPLSTSPPTHSAVGVLTCRAPSAPGGATRSKRAQVKLEWTKVTRAQ